MLRFKTETSVIFFCFYEHLCRASTPVFSGTRVPIKNLFDYLKGGDSIAEFLLDFPSVKEQQIYMLLSLAEQQFTFQVSKTALYDHTA